MLRNSIILLIVFIFLSAAGTIAPGMTSDTPEHGKHAVTLEGRVVTPGGDPVDRVEVVVPELKISGKTSRTGRFVLAASWQRKADKPRKRLGGRLVHIQAFKQGYLLSETKPFRLRGHGIVRVPDITLIPSPLEEVVVTGTSTPKLYREAPVKTLVTSRETIEEQGAADLAESLEIVTGVRVENNCQNCNFTQLRINGMEGQYSQVLINGLPMISSLAGVYGLEQIPANMIERLEVVKGGGSALYGGSAIGGVVNVMTREPQRTEARFSLDQGFIKDKPTSTISLNYDYVSDSSNTTASLSSNYRKREPVDLNDDDFSEIGELRHISTSGRLSHKFQTVDGTLRLGFSTISEDRRGGNAFDEVEHFADIAESIQTRRMDINAGWEQNFSTTGLLQINAAYSSTERDTYYGAEQDPNAYGHTDNPVFHGEARYHNFSLSNHEITGGVSFHSDGIKDTAPAYEREIDETYTDLGVFLQDAVTLGKNAQLLLGVRGDKHSAIDDAISSPRVSLSYTGIKNLTLRVTGSTGFRAPQVFDEDLHITQVSGEGMIIRNSDGLEEERSWSVNAGLDYGRQIRNRLFRFSISGFYNRLTNTFMLEETDSIENARVFGRFNGDGAKIYGLEVEAGYKIADRFELFTGWTFQRSEYDVPEPDFGNGTFFRTPDVYGLARIQWNLPGLADLRLDMNYTGPMKVPHYAGYIPEDILEDSDPFVVVNLALSRDFRLAGNRKITVTLRVVNLLDEYQEDLDQGVYRDAGYVYGPRMPRSFRVNLRYHF